MTSKTFWGVKRGLDLVSTNLHIRIYWRNRMTRSERRTEGWTTIFTAPMNKTSNSGKSVNGFLFEIFRIAVNPPVMPQNCHGTFSIQQGSDGYQ